MLWNRSSEISPFIGLRAKLSRAFETTAILAVLFTAFQLLTVSIKTFPQLGNELKDVVLTPCTGVEAAATALTQELPRQLVLTSQNIIAKSITATVKNSGKILSAGVHIINLIILQLLHRYQRLLLCFLQAIFQGSLGVVQANIAAATSAINGQLKNIQSSMNNNINQVNAQLQTIGAGASSVIGSINSIFNPQSSSPTITLPSVPDISTIQIPQDLVTSIQNLKLPTLNDIETQVGNVISAPFVAVQQAITSKFGNLTAGFNLTFAAPLQTNAAPALHFCRDKFDVSWIDSIVMTCSKAVFICIGIFIVVALVMTLFNALLIYRAHGKHERRVEELDSYLILESNNEIDELKTKSRDLIRYAKSPIFHAFAKGTSKRLFKSNHRQARMGWFLDYVYHEPSLIIAGFGIMGIILVYTTCALIDFMTFTMIPAVSHQVLEATEALVQSLASLVNNALGPFVSQVNAEIQIAESTANTAITGLVDDAVNVLNNTVGVFVRGFQDELSKALAPVPVLAQVITKFGSCVIGLDSLLQSVDEVKALLKIEFPGIDQSMVQPEDMSASLKNIISQKSSDIEGDLSSFVKGKIQGFVERLKKEVRLTLWSFYFIAGYGLLILLFGIVGAIAI